MRGKWLLASRYLGASLMSTNGTSDRPRCAEHDDELARSQVSNAFSSLISRSRGIEELFRESILVFYSKEFPRQKNPWKPRLKLIYLSLLEPCLPVRKSGSLTLRLSKHCLLMIVAQVIGQTSILLKEVLVIAWLTSWLLIGHRYCFSCWLCRRAWAPSP